MAHGWGYMHPGYRVDVRAYLSHHHWIATHMQRWSWGMGGMMGWGY